MTAVVALLVIFGIAPKVLNGASKVNGWFKRLGTISLGIYVVHMLLLGRVRDAVVDVMYDSPTWMRIGITFVILLVLWVVIVALLKKYRYTAKFLLGKV